MEPRRFERLKAEVATRASAIQVLELEDLVRLVTGRRFVEIALARRTNITVKLRICPHCAGQNVVLHGKDKNQRQRFKCQECRRTYNILTGTPMARARKPETWPVYLSCMANHTSVRKIVSLGIGIHHVTIWRWRHRFLRAAANDNASLLSGVIEADTTFFPRSFKGTRGRKKGQPPENRVDRRRPWRRNRRGSPREQVPVLTALDNSGGIYQAILPSLAAIEATLDGRIAGGSVLCSDGATAYENVADSAGAEHRCIIVPTTTPDTLLLHEVVMSSRQPGRLGLRRVNDLHRNLKQLVYGRCRGVATRYLANYLGWHRAMQGKGFTGQALLARALA